MAFGDREVFRSVSCRFRRGRISVVLGGSGSGKSTVLRLIGGLVRPQAGSMRMADNVILLLPDGTIYGTAEELRRSTDPRVVAFLNEGADVPAPAADARW